MKLLKTFSLGLVIGSLYIAPSNATDGDENAMGGMHQTAMRFVADDEPAHTGAASTEQQKPTDQPKTFKAKVVGSELVLLINDGTGEKTFPGLRANNSFADFNFDGKSHISCSPFAPAAADSDMVVLGTLLFNGVIGATNFDRETAAEAFITQCVSKLSFYKDRMKALKAIGDAPSGADLSATSTTLQASFNGYLSRVKAGLFHISETVQFLAYCSKGRKTLTDLIAANETALTKADEKDKPTLGTSIAAHKALIERFQRYEQHTLELVHALYPHGDDPANASLMQRARAGISSMLSRATTTQRGMIPAPIASDDPAYTAFMQKMLSTDCEFLQTARAKGNIAFVDIAAAAVA